MPIKKIPGTITSIVDLSATAREIVITVQEPFPFLPGSFVNVFMEVNGAPMRRAFSISSSCTDTQNIGISVRLNPKGTMSPHFWDANIIGTKIEIMGPMGFNTADKMLHENIYLFGFGIGAGVMKSLAAYFATKEHIKNLTIYTGSRSDDEVVLKDYFTALQKNNPRIHVAFVVSKPGENSPYLPGYIQDHLEALDFNHSDVYVCGQEVACSALIEKVKSHNPSDCAFFVEAFH